MPCEGVGGVVVLLALGGERRERSRCVRRRVRVMVVEVSGAVDILGERGGVWW